MIGIINNQDFYTYSFKAFYINQIAHISKGSSRHHTYFCRNINCIRDKYLGSIMMSFWIVLRFSLIHRVIYCGNWIKLLRISLRWFNSEENKTGKMANIGKICKKFLSFSLFWKERNRKCTAGCLLGHILKNLVVLSLFQNIHFRVSRESQYFKMH